MKLLHVITGLNVGGAETMLARLLECGHLSPDIRPAVATLTPPGFMTARVEATGVSVHALGMRSLWSSLSALVRLAALIRRSRPDVVIAWMHHGQIAATFAVALARTKTPIIWNVRHSLSGFVHEKRTTRVILRWQARLSGTPSAIVYNSHAAARQYRAFGFTPREEHVLPNGFEIVRRADRSSSARSARDVFGIAKAPLLIGMVARSHPMKDIPNLISAFEQVLNAGIDAHLLLVGEGMDQPGPAVAVGLARLRRDCFTLAGQRGDVGIWLESLDILALPSAWGEGFPNIVGEALLSAVPCVGTDVGDTAWLIGDAGRAVPPGDPFALAQALIELAQIGPAARRELGLAGQQRMETYFGIEEIAEQYAQLSRHVADVGATTPATTLGLVRDAA